MRLPTLKISIILILLLFGILTKALSQRVVAGKVIDEENRPIMGVEIYPENSKIGAITDMEGIFSIQVQDSIDELILIIPYASLIEEAPQRDVLYMFEQIREKFAIENRDSINFKLLRVQNTFIRIPESNKLKKLYDKKYKYELKYNLMGKLKHVYLRNIENHAEIQYVWDIEYYKDYVLINNYIWQQEKVKNKDKRFFISTINFKYDNSGAVREKAVNVNCGNHSTSSYERYNYRDNKVINVFYFEGINFPYYTNADSWEYKEDILLEVVQNEILRRKLYRRIKSIFFNSDYKLIEIK